MWWVIQSFDILCWYFSLPVNLLYIFILKRKNWYAFCKGLSHIPSHSPSLVIDHFTKGAMPNLWLHTLVGRREELGFTSPSLNHSSPEFLFLFVVLCHVYLYASDFLWTTLNVQSMYKIHGDILQNILQHFLYKTLWIFESKWLTIHYYAQNRNNNTILILISLYIHKLFESI